MDDASTSIISRDLMDGLIGGKNNPGGEESRDGWGRVEGRVLVDAMGVDTRFLGAAFVKKLETDGCLTFPVADFSALR